MPCNLIDNNQPYWNMVPPLCPEVGSRRLQKMFVPIYDITWHYNQENSNLYDHCPENLESQIHFAYSTSCITQVIGCAMNIKLQALLLCTGTLCKIDGNLKIQYKIKLAE